MGHMHGIFQSDNSVKPDYQQECDIMKRYFILPFHAWFTLSA
ncbi:hypothetical protein HMPREF9442_01848 [Paraprevotella xylaniphila YIT 11841]|uniref:Uncharacterized protein n=1 Tax=Paraprevotella xylaniphila YIT 11841 TaxID=762982 RepID=F3QUH7_9BACT|nr:hypothetical protein HMPREF9442_01848 [Paraprevotella xylaniphila YIT 11841]